MRKVFLAVGATVTFGMCSLAWAQDDKAEAAFKRLDKDGDGKITLAEFKDGKEGDKATKAEGAFKRMDKDGDGSISLAEFKEAAGKKKKKE